MLTSQHRLLVIGPNDHGLMGIGGGIDLTEPVNDITAYIVLNEGEFITQIGYEENHTMILTNQNRILTTGNNDFGQLGTGDTVSHTSFVDITNQFSFELGEYPVDIIVTLSHNALITNLNHIYMWGNNQYGQLGTGGFDSVYTPYLLNDQLPLNDGETIVFYDIKLTYNFLITSENRILAWGGNYYFQLNYPPDFQNIPTPLDVTEYFILNEGESILKIAHGWSTSYALTSDNRLFAFGNGYSGQIGNGLKKQYNDYKDITPFFNLVDDHIIDIYPGHNHIFVLTANNYLYGFGDNAYKRLGLYYDYNAYKPVEIILNNISVSSIQYAYGDDVDFPVLEKIGYEFIGWCYDYDLSKPIEEGFELIENLILYPHFEIMTFTVNFYDDDGSLLKTEVIPYGSSASPPDNPTKEPTPEFTYTFDGWDKAFDNITGNLDVYARYTSVVNTYTVNFFDEDGTLLKTEVVSYGSSANPPDDPTKEPTAEFTYTFDGWDKAFDNITGNVDVYARYASVINQYTVRFLDYDDRILKEEVVNYGGSATPPSDPSRPSSGIYVYSFNGWDNSFDNITGAIDVKALYTETMIELGYQLSPGVDTVYQNSVWVDEGLTYNHEDISYTRDGNVDTSIPGQYVLTYSVFFEETLLGQVKRIVRVIEKTDEDITITLNPGIATLPINTPYIEAGAIASQGQVNIIGTVDTTSPGIYMIEYQVTVNDVTYSKYRFVVVFGANIDFGAMNEIIIDLYRREDEES
jgi:hypothetical protein